MVETVLSGAFWPLALLAEVEPGAFSPSSPSGSWSPAFWLVGLAAMALVPFLFSMVTSFAKLVIVGGLVRQALGTPQIPPNSVITGLALILTLHIMAPVLEQSYANYADYAAYLRRHPKTTYADYRRAQGDAGSQPGSRGVPGRRRDSSAPSPTAARAETTGGKDAGDTAGAKETLAAVYGSIEGPWGRFLRRHASTQNIALFERLRQRQALRTPPPPAINELYSNSEQLGGARYLLTVLAPAFVLTELSQAFQIGFLIFVPFLVIDLVVSNILLAMGMHMLSPVTISMPFKLLLFVLVDGWRLIIQGIVSNYI